MTQPIRVGWHVAGMGGGWKEIAAEQLSLLRRVGLNEIHATHVGEGLDWLIDEARRQGLALTVCQHEPDVGNMEALAMRLIERLARAGDAPILYLHTKAASKPDDLLHTAWRRLMQRELVERWRDHLPAIEAGTADAVGVNWWRKPPSHFSGNFWLASAAWLRKLPRFDSFHRDRYSCELWIGSAPGCRVKSMRGHDRKFWIEGVPAG